MLAGGGDTLQFQYLVYQKRQFACLRPEQSMSYWWVNHKQTFKQEFEGGYIWSPKRNANGAANQTYFNLTIVSPGDIIFSYSSTMIQAIGIAERKFYPSPMPPEFGTTNENWSKGGEGYLVRVTWDRLKRPIKPKDHLATIVPLLPQVNSPIQSNGNGNQACYLAAISDLLGEELLLIAEDGNPAITSTLEIVQSDIKDELEAEGLAQSTTIPELEKLQLVKARTGQGLFRQNVLKVENQCRITGLADTRFLIASHIKPWRESTNAEKIDGNNGLLLSPHVDRLFDKALITFSRQGGILFADESAQMVATKWEFAARNIGALNRAQAQYLEYHRDVLFEANRKKT